MNLTQGCYHVPHGHVCHGSDRLCVALCGSGRLRAALAGLSQQYGRGGPKAWKSSTHNRMLVRNQQFREARPDPGIWARIGAAARHAVRGELLRDCAPRHTRRAVRAVRAVTRPGAPCGALRRAAPAPAPAPAPALAPAPAPAPRRAAKRSPWCVRARVAPATCEFRHMRV